jgi:hypothetical protein
LPQPDISPTPKECASLLFVAIFFFLVPPGEGGDDDELDMREDSAYRAEHEEWLASPAGRRWRELEAADELGVHINVMP